MIVSLHQGEGEIEHQIEHRLLYTRRARLVCLYFIRIQNPGALSFKNEGVPFLGHAVVGVHLYPYD